MSRTRDHVGVIKEIHKILTPEQQALLLAISESVILLSQAEVAQSQNAAEASGLQDLQDGI